MEKLNQGEFHETPQSHSGESCNCYRRDDICSPASSQIRLRVNSGYRGRHHVYYHSASREIIIDTSFTIIVTTPIIIVAMEYVFA